jgi:EAL domain-containing protein (putative c-di-GMP-specific phosphodiesterase class I)
VATFVAQGRFVGFHTVFQSIWDLESRRVVGFEALTRFDDGVAPDVWLATAPRRGDGLELEARMTLAAVSAARALPADANSVALMRDLRPRFAKLNDEWPVSLAEGDGSTQRLIRQLIRTADEVNCTLITQGIETQAQLDAVDGVGVRVGQGFYLGRPHQLSASETSLDLEVK